MMKTLSFDKILVGVKEYFLMAVGIMIYTFGWIEIGRASCRERV